MKSLNKHIQEAKKGEASTRELVLTGMLYVSLQAKRSQSITKYQPDYYKNEKIVPTIFLRKITHDELIKANNQNFHIFLDNILKKCISDWHGFQDKDGKEIKFNESLISSLPYKCKMELYSKIIGE